MFSWFVTNRRLSREIRELREEWQKQQIEWEEWYEKFRLLYARLARRIERAASDVDNRPPAGSSPVVLSDGPTTSLSDRQAELNAHILNRRKTRALSNGSSAQG